MGGLAPRRSSTTAIDYHYGGIARSKSMSPSRIAPNSNYNKKSNIAQSSPRSIKKYNTWTNNIGIDNKLERKRGKKIQKKSKSMVYSPKGNKQNLPLMTFNDNNNDNYPSIIDRYYSNPDETVYAQKKKNE